MHVYTLECELLTDSSLEKTFSVFEDPYNLAKITPASLHFAVTSKERIQMRKRAEIEYTIRWLGLPLHWKTLILEYEPPFLFVDEQTQGPYALWRHRHTFTPTDQGVLVGDHVEYALPFGLLGQFTHALVVRRQLESIFRFRQRELGRILGGKTTQIKSPAVTG